MAQLSTTSWEKSELYDTLCLLMIAACMWLAGHYLHLFEHGGVFLVSYGLSDFVMFGFCMSFGILAASVHKSLKLRRAMDARDVAEQEAASLARHDPLTGLANRRLLKETMEQALRQGAHQMHAVLVIDLDRFKLVNDLYGHSAGDRVLCESADRLRCFLPKGTAAARLGGDEFAIFLPGVSDTDHVMKLGEEIITCLRAPVEWTQTQLEVGATVGVALYPADGADAEALLHAADVAMYRGKREGRNAFRFFEESMDSELKARAQLERELRSAIAKGQFHPYYQPLVSLPSKSLRGFEVLARWDHPTKGVLSPDTFVQVAEETGLIAELSLSVLRQACLDAKEWPPHLQLAINVSPCQLQDRTLPERILAILMETGFSAGRLEVEITETALVNDLASARVILASLQNVGIRIALDDFGTGYSSLYHLRELQFDKIKIDRSYVQSLADGMDSMKIVNAILGLGTSLGLLTTAEGIENVANCDWLAGRGCSFGQGYLFGAPMPSGDVNRFILEDAERETASENATMAA